jgi:enoyl-[acyl-carrier protein] reductase I
MLIECLIFDEQRESMKKEKWALILGSSSGLGWATAEKLAEEEWNLILVYRERRSVEDELQESINKLKQNGQQVICFNKDALKASSQQAIAERLSAEGHQGRIDLMVHSIAKGSLKPLTGDNVLTNQDLQITLHAMALSFYDWAQLLIRHRLVNRPANFVAFTSEGSQKVWNGYAAVAVAKASLETLMKYMAYEFADLQINVNCLSPGLVETKASQAIPGFDQLQENAQKRNPQHRLTSASDAADAVFLLTQKEAAWLNGCVIPVDGGEHLQ